MLRGKDMDSDNVIAQNRLKLYILWDLDMLKSLILICIVQLSPKVCSHKYKWFVSWSLFNVIFHFYQRYVFFLI